MKLLLLALVAAVAAKPKPDIGLQLRNPQTSYGASFAPSNIQQTPTFAASPFRTNLFGQNGFGGQQNVIVSSTPSPFSFDNGFVSSTQSPLGLNDAFVSSTQSPLEINADTGFNGFASSTQGVNGGFDGFVSSTQSPLELGGLNSFVSSTQSPLELGGLNSFVSSTQSPLQVRNGFDSFVSTTPSSINFGQSNNQFQGFGLNSDALNSQLFVSSTPSPLLDNSQFLVSSTPSSGLVYGNNFVSSSTPTIGFSSDNLNLQGFNLNQGLNTYHGLNVNPAGYETEAADKVLVEKHLYFFEAPEEPLEPEVRVQVPQTPAKKNIKYIFIKAPSFQQRGPIVYQAPQVQEKTKVYVLVKRPEQKPVEFALPEPTITSKPEVFFLKYKTQEEAERLILKAKQEANLGQTANRIEDGLNIVGQYPNRIGAGFGNIRSEVTPNLGFDIRYNTVVSTTTEAPEKVVEESNNSAILGIPEVAEQLGSTPSSIDALRFTLEGGDNVRPHEEYGVPKEE